MTPAIIAEARAKIGANAATHVVVASWERGWAIQHSRSDRLPPDDERGDDDESIRAAMRALLPAADLNLPIVLAYRIEACDG